MATNDTTTGAAKPPAPPPASPPPRDPAMQASNDAQKPANVLQNPTQSTPPDLPAEKGGAKLQDFIFSGAPGTPFNVDGAGFGGAKGRVQIGGQDVQVTSWSDTRIKGIVPSYLKVGEVRVITAGGATGTVDPNKKTTTTTTTSTTTK